MTEATAILDILEDDLSEFAGRGPCVVTLDEVMVRDMAADNERLERARRFIEEVARGRQT